MTSVLSPNNTPWKLTGFDQTDLGGFPARVFGFFKKFDLGAIGDKTLGRVRATKKENGFGTFAETSCEQMCFDPTLGATDQVSN